MKTIEIALRPEAAAGDDSIRSYLLQHLGLKSDNALQFKILKRSVDARAHDVKIRLRIAYSISEPLVVPAFEKRQLQYVFTKQHAVIIGCGPAGLFAALRLIELGIKPIIIERGKTVRDRRRDLAEIGRAHV